MEAFLFALALAAVVLLVRGYGRHERRAETDDRSWLFSYKTTLAKKDPTDRAKP